MVSYGNRVRIRAGSPLDGVEGIAYDVKPERVLVLIEREVFWEVSPEQLEVLAADFFFPPKNAFGSCDQ